MTTFRRGAAAAATGLLVLGCGGTAVADAHTMNHAGWWEGWLESEG